MKIYQYTFTQYFHALSRPPLVVRIVAQRDLDAFKVWCRRIDVQELDPAHCERLVITHKELPE